MSHFKLVTETISYSCLTEYSRIVSYPEISGAIPGFLIRVWTKKIYVCDALHDKNVSRVAKKSKNVSFLSPHLWIREGGLELEF